MNLHMQGNLSREKLDFSENGNPVGMDIYDELEAYKAEEAFVRSETPHVSLTESIIDTDYILNLTNPKGEFQYRSDGESGTSPIHLTVYCTYQEYMAAYPKAKNVPYFKQLKDFPWMRISKSLRGN